MDPNIRAGSSRLLATLLVRYGETLHRLRLQGVYIYRERELKKDKLFRPEPRFLKYFTALVSDLIIFAAPNL